mmetsp:Transcript_9418/g.19851  ORF Transcript_9418/g.19851 Transcript_9418/m.19851 type:complete len:214 (+) Transcript_9418:69-710(+)
MRALLIAVVVAVWARGCVGILWELGKGADECFYEDCHQGDQVSGSYTAISLPDMLIEFRIFPPSLSESRAHALYLTSGPIGRFQFEAPETGTYLYCFKDVRNAGRGLVAFNLDNGGDERTVPSLDSVAKSEQLDMMGKTVMAVAHQASMVKNRVIENRYREQAAVGVLTSANTRVRVWANIQIILVVLLAAAQVMFMQRMFASKGGKSTAIRV